MTYKYVSERKLRWGQIALLVLACFFGTDYLITPDWAVAPSLSVVEAALPLPVWGWLFLTFGAIGLIGENWIELGRHKPPPQKPLRGICQAENRWWPSYLAHSMLCAMYATLGLGYALELVTSWHLWGFRAPALMWMIAYGHFVFIGRRRNNVS